MGPISGWTYAQTSGTGPTWEGVGGWLWGSWGSSGMVSKYLHINLFLGWWLGTLIFERFFFLSPRRSPKVIFFPLAKSLPSLVALQRRFNHF